MSQVQGGANASADDTSALAEDLRSHQRLQAQLFIAAALAAALGAMLSATGVWAVTFQDSMSKNLQRTLGGNTLTSVGVVLLIVGLLLLLCVVGIVLGPRVNRWVALFARLIAIVVEAVVALAGTWLVRYYPGWAIAYTAIGGLGLFLLTVYERELHASWPWAPLRAYLAKVFVLNTKGINVPRGVAAAGLLLLTLVVTSSQHQQVYFLSVAFGLLYVTLSDPGGELLVRLRRMTVVAVIGAMLTALGFGIGGDAWGYAVVLALVVTVLSGVVINFGLEALVAGILLNVWFLIALSSAAGLPPRVHVYPWNQALAWLIGSVIAVALVAVLWLLRGRSRQPSPLPEIPADLPPIKLSRPIVLFVLIRAIAVAGSVAIAFGLHLPNAQWMPLATLSAMKTTLAQSSFRGAQRLIGTALGAALAAGLLVTVSSSRALEQLIIVLMGIGLSIYLVNYVFYSAAVVGAGLVALDIPHPADLSAEGRRIFFTFAGIGVALLVMFLAGLLQGRKATAGTQAAGAAPTASAVSTPGSSA